MFRSCMKRSHQHFAGVWSIFLLLQQFQVVLLQNIQGTSSPYLQDASTVDNSWMPYYFSIPEHGEEYGQWEEGGGEESISNDTLNCWETIRNLTTSISAVVHQQQSETVSKINEWITSCNSTDEQQLYHFWKSQPFLSSLYTVLSAVLYSISDCPGMADNRLEEAVNEMGCELVSGVLDAMHMMMDNSSNISDETNATETESCLTEEALLLDDPMENELMEKKAEVLSESVVGMGEVLNLLKSLFETQVESERLELQAEIVTITDKIKKSMNSLEKTDEGTLKGKDNAFQNGTWHHGSRLSKKSSKCLDPAKLKEGSVPKLSNSSIRQVSRAKRSNSEAFQQYKDNSLKKVSKMNTLLK
ncbi:uncharacterized protein LOC127421956 [Myxocyprinus asiaticus]|uniref:uncharacterized protein LOC127421956 n=1 Tax=Myxocyprinus asiaticus TaxID=70543 RepID=UPI002222C422|nr:uncharacterized protein LOC127421956 [Myxocyprinus asiaticus]